MVRFLMGLLMAAVFSTTVAARAEDTPEQALARLQGSWRPISMVVGGKAINQENPAVLIIENETMRFGEVRVRFKIDAGTTPALIDLDVLNNEGAVSFEGIYQFDNQKLVFCLNLTPDAKNRPTEFASEADTNLALLTFEKAN